VQIEHLSVEMSVRIDGARQQEHPVRVDRAASGLESSGRRDLRDFSGRDSDVRRSHFVWRHGSCANDREIKHRGLSN
jgi:hypothetical protein